MSINSLIIRLPDTKKHKANLTNKITVKRERISVDIEVMNALSKEELMLYLLLDEMSSSTQEITPDQKRIAKILGTTQSTVSRRLKNLRILRMITLRKKVHSTKTWRQRQSYILFERPADVRTVLSVDQNYLVFLVEGSASGSSRVRQLCRAELKAIPKNILLSYDIFLELDEQQVNEKNQDMHSYASVHNVENQDMHSYASVHNVENPRGYIYTRAYAPAQSSIKSYGFNDNHTFQG